MVLMRRMERPRGSAAVAERRGPASTFAPAFTRLRRLGPVPHYTGLARAAMARRVILSALLAADACGSAAALALAFIVATGMPTGVAALTSLAPAMACAMLAILLHCASHGHNIRRMSPWRELSALLPATLLALLATWCVADVMRDEAARLPMIAGWAAFPITVITARLCAQLALRRVGLWHIPVLIVGEGASADAASSAFATMAALGYEVVARVAPAELGQLLTANGWRGLLHGHGATMIALAYDEADPLRPSPRVIEALARERIPVCTVRHTQGLPSLACLQAWPAGHETIMLLHEAPGGRPLSRLLKSVLDVAAAACLLLLISPLFLVLTLVIRRDGGPAFFAHTRIGRNGRAFRCLKFRTMICDSDAVLRRHLAENAAAAHEWEATRKLRRDPRVTRVGALLRKTSLDELPQLINVLRLEMSMVGPRPIVRREVSRYGDDIAYYYATRPGITGLWQISGRNDTTYARRVELDRWYVKNWTMSQDLAILVRTLPAVWSGRGAS